MFSVSEEEILSFHHERKTLKIIGLEIQLSGAYGEAQETESPTAFTSTRSLLTLCRLYVQAYNIFGGFGMTAVTLQMGFYVPLGQSIYFF